MISESKIINKFYKFIKTFKTIKICELSLKYFLLFKRFNYFESIR